MKKKNLKIGVVGLTGKWSTEVLADAIEAQTGFRLVIDASQLKADFGARKVWFQSHNLCQLDGLIIKKIASKYSPAMLNQLDILRFVESCGVRIFSRPEKIAPSINRISGTVTLQQAGIPMPPTTFTESIDEAIEAIQTYQTAILKPLFSTKARGMQLHSGKTNLKKLRKALKAYKKQQQFFYIQQKLELPGEDMGLVFLGGEYQGAYARQSNQKSWNTTIRSGGKYAPAHPSEEIIEIAHKAQQQFGLDYTTVDMAESNLGPVCFEVSAFGGFKGAKEGLGLDMAQAYADFVIAQLKQS